MAAKKGRGKQIEAVDFGSLPGGSGFVYEVTRRIFRHLASVGGINLGWPYLGWSHRPGQKGGGGGLCG